jgi:hypothetical protein
LTEIEPNLDRVYAFSNGLGLARIGNQFKYFDKQGKTVWRFEK